MRNPAFLIFLALLCFGWPALAKNTKIQVFQTEVVDGKLLPLVEKRSLKFSRLKEGGAAATFKLIPEMLHQKMDGYGANFTESCAINLLKLPRKQRREVMEKIFSKKTGAGFDYLRLPLGASDFADGKRGSYTYNDSPNAEPDPEFKHLDLSRDDKSFSLLREAIRINPHLHLMISPWTAPAWMKPNKSLHDGWLDPERYEDYAKYFVRVIRELQKKGMPVDSLTIQNEPLYATKGYPSMYMSYKDQRRFIGDYLGPILEQEKLPLRIFSHDHNWSLSEDSNKILEYDAARKYTAGVAYHCYWGSKYNMFDTHNSYPEMQLVQTECTGTESYLDGTKSHPVNDFGWWLDNQSLGAARMGPTGTTGALGWNLCLDEKNGPQNGIKDDPMIPNGGCTTCRGMVKMDFSGEVPEITYNGEFHALAQVSRFITPGSYRIEVEGDPEGLIGTGFLNADGTIAFVAHNSTDEAKKFRVAIGKEYFDYELPGKFAATFVWKR